MLHRRSITFAEPYAQHLRAAGLDCFDSLLHAPLGEPVSCEARAEVRRLTLPGRDGRDGRDQIQAYLKRTAAPRPRQLVNAALRGSALHSDACREAALLLNLRRAGFDTMTPIAWGQTRRLGVPGAGFLLVEAVPGREVHQLLTEADPASRQQILRSVARLTARLHAAGFYQVVRFKDLITPDPAHTGAGADPGDSGDDPGAGNPGNPGVPGVPGVGAELPLVLIDRAAAFAGARRYSRRACAVALARTARRLVRGKCFLLDAELEQFVADYVETLTHAGRRPLTPPQALAKLAPLRRPQLK